MDARALTLPFALGRVAIGAALIATPGRVAAGWIGQDGDGPRLLAVAVGARDLAVGLGTTAALRRGKGARSWVLAGGMADFGDLAATLRFREAVPPPAAAGIVALTSMGGAASLWLARRLD